MAEKNELTPEEGEIAVNKWLNEDWATRYIRLSRGHWEDIIPVITEAQLAKSHKSSQDVCPEICPELEEDENGICKHQHATLEGKTIILSKSCQGTGKSHRKDDREKIAEPIDNLMAELTVLLLGGDKTRVASLQGWSEEKINANFSSREKAIDQILALFDEEVIRKDERKRIITEVEKISRVIDWEDDVGVWREMKEEDWQALRGEDESKKA